MEVRNLLFTTLCIIVVSTSLTHIVSNLAGLTNTTINDPTLAEIHNESINLQATAEQLKESFVNKELVKNESSTSLVSAISQPFVAIWYNFMKVGAIISMFYQMLVISVKVWLAPLTSEYVPAEIGAIGITAVTILFVTAFIRFISTKQ